MREGMGHIMVSRLELRLLRVVCVDSHSCVVTTWSGIVLENCSSYSWYDWTVQLPGLNTKTIELRE